MSEPRRIFFKTYRKPESAIVYDLHKCHPDIFLLEQDWEFVEAKAFDELLDLKNVLKLNISELQIENLRLKDELTAAREEILRLNEAPDMFATSGYRRSNEANK